MAVEFDRAVRHQLTRLGTGRTETHPIDDVVQARLEQLNQLFARVATATLGFGEVLAELLLEHAVHALELLLFAQLLTVVRGASTRNPAVLTRLRVQFALGVERATSALEKQIGTLATRELAFGSNVSCHVASP